METINWLETLGWGSDQIEDFRIIGYAYLRQGQYLIALEFFKALVALNTENAYDAQTLGALYLQMGEPKKAVEILEKALILDADHAPTLLNLCKAFFLLNKTKEALRLAMVLKNDKDLQISSMAKALILAYSDLI